MAGLFESICFSNATNTFDTSVPAFAHSKLYVAIILLLVAYFFVSKPHAIYLIDFACYLPPAHLRVSTASFIEHFEISSVHRREAIDFQTKVLERAGIGCETALPLCVHELPPDKSMARAQEEIETVLSAVVEDLLSKHKVNPKSIDILVSNCSIFCPTPSVTDMIINKFGLRSNVKSVSLSGMGCSAGLVAVSLAKDLLRVQGNSMALVLSMEAMTPSGYGGRTKSMLLANTLFRMGGAAVLLSNKKQDKLRSKYRLRNLVRTHLGSDEQSYQSVFQKDDDSGNVGVSLSRSLLQVAANALRINMTELGPSILPFSEQFLYAWSVILGKVLKSRKKEIYVPRFKKAFEHFCIHAGGRAVIDAVEESLNLQKKDTEASRMSLHRFGNTSSSSVWYELSYLEAKGRIRRGDKVWQIAFGSGFKCNSAIWECISEIDQSAKNAWSESINLYPVSIPDIADH